jgi:hypothetical protein
MPLTDPALIFVGIYLGLFVALIALEWIDCPALAWVRGPVWVSRVTGGGIEVMLYKRGTPLGVLVMVLGLLVADGSGPASFNRVLCLLSTLFGGFLAIGFQIPGQRRPCEPSLSDEDVQRANHLAAKLVEGTGCAKRGAP